MASHTDHQKRANSLPFVDLQKEKIDGSIASFSFSVRQISVRWLACGL